MDLKDLMDLNDFTFYKGQLSYEIKHQRKSTLAQSDAGSFDSSPFPTPLLFLEMQQSAEKKNKSCRISLFVLRSAIVPILRLLLLDSH